MYIKILLNITYGAGPTDGQERKFMRPFQNLGKDGKKSS